MGRLHEISFWSTNLAIGNPISFNTKEQSPAIMGIEL